MVDTNPLLHRLKQKNPKKHNHYGFQDFFQFDQDRGSIVDWNGAQNVLT